MSIADFDAWKEKLTQEALEYRRHDDLTTRENVSIENLLETDLICEESVEDEYLRLEEERQALPKDYKVMNELLDTLTPVQKRRYYKAKALGMSSRDIAEEDGCSHTAVLLSLEAAEKRLNKELKKRGYIE
jgi:DNA-directed RNA polymerase specialized sigma24 family protein